MAPIEYRSISSRNHGFTLIEVLISVLILSSVIMLASQSYRYFVIESRDFNNTYSEKLRLYQREQLIKRSIESSFLYMTNKSNLFYTLEQYPYWIGKENELTAITIQSVQDPDIAAVYQIKKEGDDFVYCEKLIDSWLPQSNKVPEGICNFSLVVKNDIEQLTISYFGFDNYQTLININQKDWFPDEQFDTSVKWHNQYNGEERKLTPHWIKIVWHQKNNDIDSTWLIPVNRQDYQSMISAYRMQLEGN